MPSILAAAAAAAATAVATAAAEPAAAKAATTLAAATAADAAKMHSCSRHTKRCCVPEGACLHWWPLTPRHGGLALAP